MKNLHQKLRLLRVLFFFQTLYRENILPQIHFERITVMFLSTIQIRTHESCLSPEIAA